MNHGTAFGARWVESESNTCPGSQTPSCRPGGCSSCQRYQAATLSSASSYYGNGDTFSWTEARPALRSRHSPIRANLGNDFSASLYMTHIYLQASYQVCWLQGIPFKPPRPTAARGPGNIGGCCGWCLKTHSACLRSYLLTVVLRVFI